MVSSHSGERAQRTYLKRLMDQRKAVSASLEAATDRYRAGLTEYRVLLQTQLALLRVDQALIRARRQVWSQRIRLLRARRRLAWRKRIMKLLLKIGLPALLLVVGAVGAGALGGRDRAPKKKPTTERTVAVQTDKIERRDALCQCSLRGRCNPFRTRR